MATRKKIVKHSAPLSPANSALDGNGARAAKEIRKAKMKAEIAEQQKIRASRGVKGWARGQRNAHVNPHVDIDRASGDRVKPKPSLDDYDRFTN